MEKTLEKKQNSLPDINNHNHFAKIIKNFFHDDFVFSDCWYEKQKINLVEYNWVQTTSSKFKKTVFKKDGELQKYILGYIHSNKDLEELERLISIYRGIFINSSSFKQREYIEKECREVFYKPSLENKIRRKYQCIHNKRKYLCVDCDGASICKHKRIKYSCVDCGGSQICEHKRRRVFCKMCNYSALRSVSSSGPSSLLPDES